MRGRGAVSAVNEHDGARKVPEGPETLHDSQRGCAWRAASQGFGQRSGIGADLAQCAGASSQLGLDRRNEMLKIGCASSVDEHNPHGLAAQLALQLAQR